ncbi:hypothetical protein TNCV_4342381 [Trichonephila clavipes]|nr:hypothetical protein TNCV_4342381 [Trichonephila clavipes]
MHPVYHLETHYLVVIHRQVYRNLVDTCILNIPVGTELQVNGCKKEYITNTFVRIKDGFLYNFLDHSHESNCFFSRYVSNPTGWILTREAMLDLILSGFSKPSTDHAKGLIWTDEMVWTMGKRPHPDWTLVGYLQWKFVRPQGKLFFRSFNDLILSVQQADGNEDGLIKSDARILCNKGVKSR